MKQKTSVDFEHDESQITEYLLQAMSFTRVDAKTFDSFRFTDAQGWKTSKSIATKILKKSVYILMGVARASNWSSEMNDINNYLQREGIACSVCQEGFETRDFVSRLPCGHFFHEGCIARWFVIRNAEVDFTEMIENEWSFDDLLAFRLSFRLRGRRSKF